MKETFSKSEHFRTKGGKNWPIYQKKISFERRRYLGEEIKLLPLYFKVESG
ncbi:hypothetical protein SPAR145_2172 [Streptococcus pneumoniae NP127]|nr:hypothetical protein SPAR145_2172 [Streptococcus pneumoniae NP127]